MGCDAQSLARDYYRLLLFMSVDMIGSTSFKFSKWENAERPFEERRGWRPAVRKFYQEFDASLRLRLSADKAPKLWKALGDELIYVVPVVDRQQVAAIIRGFMDAIKDVRSSVREVSKSLDLKGCAWVADFPARNAMIDPGNGIYDELDGPGMAEGDQQHDKLDYVGPSMDTGFRLGKLASRRKFPVSVELAYILAEAENDSEKGLKFGYDGRAELKGVLGGEEYPAIWLDTEFDGIEKEVNRKEGALLGIPKITAGEVTDFCSCYIGASQWLEVPFLRDELRGVFSTPPASAVETARHYRQRQREEPPYDENAGDGGLDEGLTLSGEALTDLMPKPKSD